MKNFITIILTFFIVATFVNNSNAQCDDTQVLIAIDNPSFEDWASEGSYEDPSPGSTENGGGFWDTSNKVVDLYPTADITVTKSTDAHSGTYSARLETSSVNIIVTELLTAATLFTGYFDPNPANPIESVKFGKPFTETPDYFRVWYQYEPVQGDSAEIYCYLDKGENNETRIATAYTKIYDATTGWTELVLPFVYDVEGELPETITLVFASSADGDNFEGQVGNTLYVDDVELIKCTTPNENLISEAFTTHVFPNPSFGENLQFEFSEAKDVVLSIFSVDGKKVFTADVNADNYELDIAEWNNGFYQYVINDKDSNEAISRGSFVIQ